MNFENVLNSTYTLVSLIVLVLSFVVLCLYYGLVWLRVGRYKRDVVTRRKRTSAEKVPPSTALPSVSVVMVVHNEAEYLKKSIPYLLEQDYPDYEVVVVDYKSTDETHFVLHVCSENYPQLKAINFHQDVNMFQGKKYPLSIGIKSATKDVILLTEAECTPRSFNWISRMMQGYCDGGQIVMGYNLVKPDGTLLGAFQQYENMTYNASYIGATIMGNPFTATGRNLSYRRDFFFSRGGFISHYSIPDGADDLFVNQNANRANTAVTLREGAGVVCDGSHTLGEWRLKRLHRRSTRRYYSLKDKLQLSVYPLSQLLFILALVLLFVGGICPWQLLVGVMAVKIIWQIVCCMLLTKRFQIKTLHFLSPFFEIYFLISDTIIALSSLRKKNVQWR